ncbi:stalk domain-containing protein [Paenibacillus sp. FSL H7-0350]|uniref:stalk domain-containing protein n=1 Tax=Paenibacillus sp. FSL H7-0350 TaxID=2975345 RepID=UPI0031581A03
MKKVIIGFLCGALFFSGVSYAASGSLTAKLTSYKIFINGNEKILKNKPVSINGTTYLPLREISEAVGYSVVLENGKLLLNNGSVTTPTSNNSSLKQDDYTEIGANSLKLKVDDKYYGLAISTPIYVKGSSIYLTFNASLIDLIVSIASNDYKIYETNNDNPDFITAEHFASSYKYLELIEKQKSYSLNNTENGKRYEIVTDKNSSKGVIFLEANDRYLIPINDVFKSLELNMEAIYEPNQKRVVLKFK